jgi:glycosyltransferase involved in cell wall biosynthesis
MSDPSAAPPARLFTTWGTVLYVDPTGELRHGPIESGLANAVLVTDERPDRSRRWARLAYKADGSSQPIAYSGDRLRASADADTGGQAAGTAALELVPLERGLLALRIEGKFLCAEPDGRVALRPVCSTWECYLASEAWCSAHGSTDVMSARSDAVYRIDRLSIKKYIVDPRLRLGSKIRPARAKILIFGYPQWSHGRVYYDVAKQLHPKGYVLDIANWQINHLEYMDDLLNFYDMVLTSPDGVRALADDYRVPYERMIVVSHQEMDIRALVEQKGVEVFEKFAAYGVVSEFVYCSSLLQGVRRPPKVVSLGVDFDEFYCEPPNTLRTVGYASSMSVTTFGVEWKRGHLAERAAAEAGLAFKVAGSTGDQTSFHEMPNFYKSVDAVLTSSISEAAQLPVMEAAAAGRLVIGTPVGHFPLKAYQGGGIIAPIEAEKFVAFTAQTLKHFRANTSEFVRKCSSIQEAARQFDWQFAIGDWVQLLEGVPRNQSD